MRYLKSNVLKFNVLARSLFFGSALVFLSSCNTTIVQDIETGKETELNSTVETVGKVGDTLILVTNYYNNTYKSLEIYTGVLPVTKTWSVNIDGLEREAMSTYKLVIKL